MSRKLAVILLVLAGGLCAASAPAPARAAEQCGLPSYRPHWIDFADGSVQFWETFARPGVIAAAANFIYPPKLREAGARTVYWDMYLKNRVGIPSAPADPSTIVARANKLFDYAAASSDCATPLIAENELFGAGLVTPWSETNAQYRANVLLYLQTLASRGARAFLLVSSAPYTGSEEAAEWWRQVAAVADIVPEVYIPAPRIYAMGPIVGNRQLRTSMRKAIRAYADLGIPTARLGIVLGFQTERGKGGRDGLEPAQAWFEVVKWQVLAARQVAAEQRIGSIWSWGWGHWGTKPDDPDKPRAACVYLWTRQPSLCNGLRAAGPGFNASRSDGQIRLAKSVQCQVGRRQVTNASVSRLEALTGDRELAATALYARAVENEYARVSPRRVVVAERTVIALRFGGSVAAYRAALAGAHVSITMARGIVEDELRHAQIETGLRAPRPSAAAVRNFYFAYPDLLARRVHAKPAPWWLGGRMDGIALSSLAPERVFKLGTGRSGTVRDLNGKYLVRALGEPMPLGALPLVRARPAISAALSAFALGAAFERWTVGRQTYALRLTTCQRDELPAPGAVQLASFVPFLSLTGTAASESPGLGR